jgi:hypothetical protein
MTDGAASAVICHIIESTESDRLTMRIRYLCTCRAAAAAAAAMPPTQRLAYDHGSEPGIAFSRIFFLEKSHFVLPILICQSIHLKTTIIIYAMAGGANICQWRTRNCIFTIYFFWENHTQFTLHCPHFMLNSHASKLIFCATVLGCNAGAAPRVIEAEHKSASCDVR